MPCSREGIVHRRSPQASALTLLGSPVRRYIVDILANLPLTPTDAEPHSRREGLTAAQLSLRLGLHVTTVRFHLDQLVAGDLLRAHDKRVGVGRPRRHYAINPGSLGEVRRPDAYRLLADLLADSLDTGSEPDVRFNAEEAAERWVARNEGALIPSELGTAPARTPGRFLAKVGGLIDLMERWGYESAVRTTDAGRTAHIEIAHCPLRELALRNPAVACGVHRGLLRAALAALGETETEIGLRPFTDSDPCVARITSHAAFTVPEGEL
nr:helix-turn-helix domain-containing protein [Propionibacterium sp.]